MPTFWSRWHAWRMVRRAAAHERAHTARSVALIEAVVAKDVATVERLLTQGADPNGRYGQRPLLLAVIDGCQNPADWDDGRPGARGNAMLEALLAAGAHPDAQPATPSPHAVADPSEPWVRAGLFNHDHPLHQAVSDGFVGAVVRLLRHGANPHAWARVQGQDLGRVLHQARDAAMAQALLDGGADPLAVNECDETALERARRTLPEAQLLHVVLERAEVQTLALVDADGVPSITVPTAPRSRSRL